jgi:hypothetical protein
VTGRNTTTEIPIGRVLVKIAGEDRGVRLPTTGDSKFFGASQTSGLHISKADGTVVYPVKTPINVKRKGRIVLQVEEAVSADDAVFVRIAPLSGNTLMGTLRNDADTATCVACTNIRFVESTTGAGLVLCEVNFN